MVFATSPAAPRLRAPFPWPGGKTSVAADVWARFGDVPNYVEPFFGSGAVLLKRPPPARPGRRIETVNDMDGLLVNFWRAMQADPQTVAHFADWPVSELDLHARHRRLVKSKADLAARLVADESYFDAETAGVWVWGLSCWIGTDFCADRQAKPRRMIPRGVDGWCYGALPRLTGHGGGVNVLNNPPGVFASLSERLRRVRIVCGDWRRVLTPAVTRYNGETAIFLDPPYGGVRDTVYSHDARGIAADVSEWAQEHGRVYRIAVCGLADEHANLTAYGWQEMTWRANGGYANQNRAAKSGGRTETIWFSPRCLNAPGLFDSIDPAT